jgi:hypothetical protein
VTTHGVLILDLIGLALIFLVLNQVRRNRLYVGYGVLFGVAITGACAVLSIPALLFGITRLVGAVYPASAMALVAFCFIVFMLVYILTQVTLLSNRLARLIQELAIERARLDREKAER